MVTTSVFRAADGLPPGEMKRDKWIGSRCRRQRHSAETAALPHRHCWQLPFTVWLADRHIVGLPSVDGRSSIRRLLPAMLLLI
jgi:hypothetical protein